VKRSGVVRQSCVVAISSWPESVGQLSEWVRDAAVPSELRIAAAKSLGEHGTSSAADVLVATLKTPRQSPSVRRALREVIATSYPDRAGEIDDAVVVDGQPWLMVGGAVAFGNALSAVGELGQLNLGVAGGITGVISGGTAGLLYGEARPMEAGDAAFIATTGTLGAVSGGVIGSGLDESGAPYGRLIGSAVGFGGAAALHRVHQGSAGDSVEAVVVASALTATVAGITAEVGGTPSRVGLGSTLAAGTLAAQALAPQVDVSSADVGLIGLTTGLSFSTAMLWPTPWNSGTGRVLIGLGTGPLIGYGLAHGLELEPQVQTGAIAGSAYGGVLGYGAGLVINPNAPRVGGARGGMIVGSVAGMGLGAWRTWADPDPIDPDDVMLAGAATAFMGWQAVGWGVHLGTDERGAGALVMLPAVVGGTVALSASALDVSTGDTLAAASFGIWGGYIGGVSGRVTGSAGLPAVLIGSSVGVLVGGVVQSPMIGAPPVVIGMADAGGVIGGSAAAIGTAIATSKGDTILVASLVGSGIGAVAGGAIGAGWVARGETRDMALMLPKTRARVSVVPLSMQVDGVRHDGAELRVTGW
jgi:hypothetical protein